MVAWGHMCPSYSHISGSFDYQYLWKELIDLLNFLHGNNHQERLHLRLPLLVGFGQLYLLSNQTAGIIDHQYLWKKLNNILHCTKNEEILNGKLHFLCSPCVELVIKGRYHLRLLIWVSVVPLVQSGCMQDSLFISISEKNQAISYFLYIDLAIKYKWRLRVILLIGHGQLCLSPYQIAEFFDHQFLWKESSDILLFCMDLVIKYR